MAKKKKFYAVTVGHKTGIFTSNAEALKQIKGYKNSKLKAFTNNASAINWFNSERTKIEKADKTKVKINEILPLPLKTEKNTDSSQKELQSKRDFLIAANSSIEQLLVEEGYTLIWTDGSASDEEKIATWAFVLQTERKRFQCSGLVDGEHEKNSATAEVIAVIEAIQLAMNNNKKKLVIFHDFQQLASWATGNAKQLSACAKLYTTFLDSIKNVEEIRFVKVKAHSGDVMNNLVDTLAYNHLKKIVNF